MTNIRLKELIEEFVEAQSDNDTDEWYCTSQEISVEIMQNFLKFLEEKKLKIKADLVKY